MVNRINIIQMRKGKDSIFDKILNLYTKPNEVLIPRKSLGQHKLVKKSILEKIGSFAKKDEIVLEIGGGEGNLTKILEKNSKLVICFEIDERNFNHLKKIIEFGVIIRADFLKTKLEEIYRIYEKEKEAVIKGDAEKVKEILSQKEKIKIISNIPFYISSQLIHKIITEIFVIKSVHLLTQHEFAEKVSANEGSENYSAISCITRFFFEPKIEFIVPNFFFRPIPKVNAAFLSLYPKEKKVDLFYQDNNNAQEKILKFIDFCYQSFKRRKKLIGEKRVYQISPDEIFEEFRKRTKLL
jgi:16S rRNA (adenine1518-N6/adenine1519-N6)-dimethyltransferase